MSCSADKFEKLPTFVKPIHYNICLKPSLETFQCPGRVDIDVSFVEKTNFLKLSSAVNKLINIDLKLEDGKVWQNLKYTLDNKWKTINIEFPQEIGPQKAKLSIDYKAEITQKMNGLYRSSYKASDGSTKYIASTQFESDTARSVFPSFDEPLYKATFDIQMEVDEKLTALSNMNVIEETKLGEGTKLVRFATTPIMSTYLIAVAIGDFEYIETTYGQNNIPIRVYTLPGKKETTKFCLEVAKQSMEWFEDWFDYKSPIPKVDLIAIPDFSMGAMENWGLVTFREILLLVDKETTHRRKAMCALTTAHELGHFWFGNLTTMEWWCDLWLKEGFASFMEYLFVSRLYPEMKTSIDYLSDVTSSALYLDSLRSSHKIEVEINDPNELTGIYDDITYSKSNAIIRQLYYYLGEETFREGLRLYIKRFAFKNAVTQDLWTALSDASHQDINKLMSCWTQQIGYPLITVREEKLEGGKRRLHLRQTRYLADGSTDEQTLWQIPITIIKTSNVTEPVRFLMTQAEQEIVLDNVASDEWVKLNADTSGFYRVQYSEDMLKHLLGAIHSGKLGVLDRFGLVSDLFAIVKSGRAPASQFLELVAALVNENELIIWRCVESGLRSFINILDRNQPELKKKLDEFICNVFEPVSSRLGWKFESGGDPHQSQLRALILSSLSKSNHGPTNEKALQLFEEYQKTKEIHPEIRAMVFGAVARNHENGTKLLMDIYEKSESNEVRQHVIMAIAQTSDVKKLEEIFKYAIVDSKVKPQDLYLLMASCSTHRHGQDFVYDWFKKNHQKLIELYGGPTESVFLSCFEYSVCSQSTEEFASELENFYNSCFDNDTQKACERVFQQSCEAVKLNAKLYQIHSKSISEFLSGKH